MYERCREAYWAKGKGQRVRGVVRIYETGIYLFIQRGRIIFYIMQSIPHTVLRSQSEISRVILLAKGKKKKKKRTRPIYGIIIWRSKNENHKEMTLLKERRIIIILVLHAMTRGGEGTSAELLKCRVPRNSETRAQNQPVNLGNSSDAWTHAKRTRRN